MSLETSANADEENENCTRGFPVRDVDVSRALRASDARLNRKWERAMVDSGRRCRDDDGRPGDYVRAFARANGIGRASRRELWMAWSGGEGKRAAAKRRKEWQTRGFLGWAPAEVSRWIESAYATLKEQSPQMWVAEASATAVTVYVGGMVARVW